MTIVAVAAYLLLSIGIVALHVVAWLATYPETGPDGFWARVGWPPVTVLLGSAWTIAFVFACWRIVRSPRPRPFSAPVVLAAVVLTPEILSVLVNLPYKGVSSSEFLDAFLFPGGITPGGNGTLQSVLMAAASAGIAAVQFAHVVARSRRRTVVA